METTPEIDPPEDTVGAIGAEGLADVAASEEPNALAEPETPPAIAEPEPSAEPDLQQVHTLAPPHATRLRPRRAQPWNFGSVLPWGILATLGDPLLLLAPLAFVTFASLAILGGGIPATSHVFVPLWSLPPFDAYQDAGVVQVLTDTTWAIWILRAIALVVRAAVFGAVAHLALQRARNMVPDLQVAISAVRRNAGSLLTLELASYGLFGIPLLLGQSSLDAPGRQVSQVGALVGQLVLINAFFASLDGAGVFGALRSGVGWVLRRPLGHLMLCVVATAAANGVFALAHSGEVGVPRPLPLAAYALVNAVIATMFLAAFARRFDLLYRADG